MTPVEAFAIATGVVTFAGIVRGFSGFGAGLVMAPALSVLFGPAAAIAGISLIDLPAVLYFLPEAWRHGEWRSVIPLGIAGVSTVPVGAWLLVHMDQELLRRTIGLVVLGFVVVLALGWRYRGVVSLPLTLGVGVTSGLLGGAMGIPGPPTILFYLSGPAHAWTARASIMGYFVFTSAMVLAVYTFHGLYTEAVLWRSAGLIPAYVGGVWLGNRLFGKVSEVAFRRVALVLLVTVAITALLT